MHPFAPGSPPTAQAACPSSELSQPRGLPAVNFLKLPSCSSTSFHQSLATSSLLKPAHLCNWPSAPGLSRLLAGGQEEGTQGWTQPSEHRPQLTRSLQGWLCSAEQCWFFSFIFFCFDFFFFCQNCSLKADLLFLNTSFKNKHWLALFILFIYYCSFNSGLETDCGRNIHMLQCRETTPLDHAVTHAVTGTLWWSTACCWV